MPAQGEKGAAKPAAEVSGTKTSGAEKAAAEKSAAEQTGTAKPGAASTSARSAPAGAAGAAGAGAAGVGTATSEAPGAGASKPVTMTSRTVKPTAPARRVRLSVARVDPWSVMKMSFLLSVAAGIALVVMTALLWMILDGMGVFADVDRLVKDIQPTSTESFQVMDYIGLGRVVSLSIVIGVIDIVLITAIATVAAFLYNICSSLVGGVQLTLTDD